MSDRLFSRMIALLVIAFACAVPALCDERIVDLIAQDGTKLKASYFDAGKPGPGVLLLHQCNRDRKVWDGLAEQLAAAGINVLTLDNRGFGESGGEPHDKLTPQEEGQIEARKWPRDIDTAFHYLITQPGVTRDMIGVGGASCGVNNSIQTARRHPQVRSLVLLSGPTNMQGRQFLRDSANLPVFFGVADDDEFPGTVQAVEWLYSLTPNSGKKFIHYVNGGHGAEMFPVHPELLGTIVEWYVTTLIKTPGRAPVVTDAPAIPPEVHDLDLIEQPGGATKVAKELQDARDHDRKVALMPEAMVNTMGYEHLQTGDVKGAVEILKLNVVEYPNSANVYDSVADAYLADGQKDLARQNTKRALELLASDKTDNEHMRDAIKESAERKMKQLGDAPQ
jgi:pimeloyl-ACP methyl ester carboxylesterase